MTTRQKKEIEQGITVFTGLKIHCNVYIFIIAFTWLVWLAFGGMINMHAWPVYTSFGWGLLLLIHFLIVYRIFRVRNKRDIL